MNGIINIIKPRGMTSHDVVNFIRKCIHIKKVGHTGTLDPEAAGVLLICVGKATKAADLIVNNDKEYRAELKLGVITDTQDSSGKIIERKSVNVSEELLAEVINMFKGTIMQVPPMYSALKVNGQKLYELARKGINVERKPRKVEVKDIKIVSSNFNENVVFINVKCSKGTYIRTLCSDIGNKIGCGAHMSFLVRTGVGDFNINKAITLEHFKQCVDNKALDEALLPVDTLFLDFPRITVEYNIEQKIINGNQIRIEHLCSDFDIIYNMIYRVYNKHNIFLCLSKVVDINGKLYLKLVKSFY